MNDKQDTGIKTNPEQGPAFASRRTVVKGLASAVPVVLTIGCGQAMANASNHQCIVNTEQPQNKDECIEVKDSWMRSPVTVTDKNGVEVTEHCLVYFNENGEQIEKSPGIKSYAITESCYASFTFK